MVLNLICPANVYYFTVKFKTLLCQFGSKVIIMFQMKYFFVRVYLI